MEMDNDQSTSHGWTFSGDAFSNRQPRLLVGGNFLSKWFTSRTEVSQATRWTEAHFLDWHARGLALQQLSAPVCAAKLADHQARVDKACPTLHREE